VLEGQELELFPEVFAQVLLAEEQGADFGGVQAHEFGEHVVSGLAVLHVVEDCPIFYFLGDQIGLGEFAQLDDFELVGGL
jgi:hypothetical protein